MRVYFLIFISFLISNIVVAQVEKNSELMFGAEVYIEPGQTAMEIDHYFKILKDQNLGLTRVRITESYCKDEQGNYNFDLFDLAFIAAEKYSIKIYGNLFPTVSNSEIGGLKFPDNEQNLKDIATYIKQTVTHFKKFKSLYGWVPINEPGSGKVPQNIFAINKFDSWKQQQKHFFDENLPNYYLSPFKEQAFLTAYNTWYLSWLVSEIKKYDPARPIHVNNHAIFQLASEYDFPAWRKQISSLGGSAHASWHFSYFRRSDYNTAVSVNSEILRSGAGELPWLMTELQGGTNVFSGSAPLSPTPNEISQWLWTVISTGGKGAIFWCLNSRKQGLEAGEWAMLDYQEKPSKRLTEVAKVAKVVANNQQLFSQAQVLESGVNILYTRESLWTEKKFGSNDLKDFDGRKVGAVMKSALAFFKSYSDLGIQANFKEITEFDFTKDNYHGITIVLANQISIPTKFNQQLQQFVKNGGTLIVEGLTGYFDESENFNLNSELTTLFGAKVKEFEIIGDSFSIKDKEITLPSHYISGILIPVAAKPFLYYKDTIVGTINNFGRGKVIWIPSMIGLGSLNDKKNVSLPNFLKKLTNNVIPAFKTYQQGVYTKTLTSSNTNITTVINQSNLIKNIEFNCAMKNPRIIFNSEDSSVNNEKFTLKANQIVVFTWDKN